MEPVPRIWKSAGPSLDLQLQYFPPTPVVLTLGVKLLVTAGMESDFRDAKTQPGTREHVGGPMFASHEAGERHRERRAVAQHPCPWLGILVGQYGSHRPGKHGVSAGEGSIDGVVFEKIAVAIAHPRTLTRKNELHRRIDEEGY